MPAINSVMQRLGFVRLRDFGLVLTPEGRILSIRPAVLDDGIGGRIVGWKDDDLAEVELGRWGGVGEKQRARPAAPPAVASRVAVRPPPTPVSTASQPEHVVLVSRSAGAARVAPEAVVDEDDWEWTIAIARARAAADEVEQAAQAVVRPSPRRLRADTVPPPAAPPAAPIARTTMPTGPVPVKTFDTSDATNRHAVPTVAAPSRIPPPLGLPTPAHPLPVVRPVLGPPSTNPRSFARGPSPITVIPVPKLGTTAPAKVTPVVRQTQQAPIVRTTSVQPTIPSLPRRPTGPSPVVPIPPAQPRRFAKGTGPVIPEGATSSRPVAKVETPDLSVGDQTLPSLILPPAARAVSLPSVLARK